MWQRRLFVMRRSVMTRLCLIGRRLDDTVSRPSALQSCSSSRLTFDPCIHLSIGLVCVGGAYRVPQVPVPQTFQGESLVEAPGGLLQLCVLGGEHLWWSGGQQVGVGVGLDGRHRRIVGIGLALLHRQEGPAGFGTGHFDSSLVAYVTAVGGRGYRGLLGGVAVVEQRVVRCDWLSVGLGLLSLQLLLFPPDVVQQDLTVPPSSSSSSSPRTPSPPSTLGESIIRPRPSVCQRL